MTGTRAWTMPTIAREARTYFSKSGPGQAATWELLTFAGTLGFVGFGMEKTAVRLANLMAFDATAFGNWGCHPSLYPEAIKLVYASIFTDSAQAYFEAIHYKIEEEKMAVIIQEVIGKRYLERFYPELSGTARSYNYYPMGAARPENGVVSLALGLGKLLPGPAADSG